MLTFHGLKFGWTLIKVMRFTDGDVRVVSAIFYTPKRRYVDQSSFG
jgi:hypothetical protein